MRISNEERRNMARKLRSLDEHIDGMPSMCTKQEHDAMALRAIRAVVGKGDIFHLLADLIDRPTTKREGDAASIGAVLDAEHSTAKMQLQIAAA